MEYSAVQTLVVRTHEAYDQKPVLGPKRADAHHIPKGVSVRLGNLYDLHCISIVH